VVERLQVPIDLFLTRKLGVQRADHNDRKLQALGLVDGHHLDVAFRKRAVRILVFVDPAIEEQSEEAVEKMKAQELAVFVGDNRVVIVTLEDVQKLRKDRQIAGVVLVSEGGRERRQGQEFIEQIRRAVIKRLIFREPHDLERPLLEF
jgi:hypothetical protein